MSTHQPPNKRTATDPKGIDHEIEAVPLGKTGKWKYCIDGNDVKGHDDHIIEFDSHEEALNAGEGDVQAGMVP